MRILRVFGILLFVSAVAATRVLAAPIPLGPAVVDGGVTGAGPWLMTTVSATGTYAFVGFETTTLFAFQDLDSLVIDYDAITGGAGLGSPRVRLLLDLNGNNAIDAADRSVSVYVGTSPSYNDDQATLDGLSPAQLINDDGGRYDTSAFVGGSPFTTHTVAVGLLGALNVLRIGVVQDPYDRVFQLNGFSGNVTAAVPEPSTMALLGLGVAALIRRRKSLAAIR